MSVNNVKLKGLNLPKSIELDPKEKLSKMLRGGRPQPTFGDGYSKAPPTFSGIKDGHRTQLLRGTLKYAAMAALPEDPKKAGLQVAKQFKDSPHSEGAARAMMVVLNRVLG
jgi:hypothetical protein